MEDLVIIGLRMLERLLVVGFGGMSIYLGYKLFFHLPHQTDQKGEIELPGIKVVLSRVGPGVFFLVFGAFILITNLHQGIETRSSGKVYNEISLPDDTTLADASSSEVRHFAGAIPVLPETEKVADMSDSGSDSIEQARHAALEAIGDLNCLAHWLGNQGKMTLRIENLIYHAKKLYLLDVWHIEAWGEQDQLTEIEVPISDPELKEVLNYVSMDCEL
jgi:hypothetical protein